MFISMIIYILYILPLQNTLHNNNNYNDAPYTIVPPWQEGYLDFHHIHAGVNVATFVILPDGSTMLIDCGDLDLHRFQQKYGQPAPGRDALYVIPPYPNNSKTTGGWVVDYIHHFWPYPNITMKKIDTVLITHFHQDHIGSIFTNNNQQVKGRRGNYIRTGIVEVGDDIDFGTFIDRGYPEYDFPFNLENEWESPPFVNYLEFLRSAIKRGTEVQKFQVGSFSQIQLKNNSFGHFRVRNIKANLNISAATPGNQTVTTIDGDLLKPSNKTKSGYTYDENKVSVAIVMEYGNFRYYEGGDQEFHNTVDPPNGPLELDTVTPTALLAGRVHVATLNHHGHGVQPAFCDVMDPKVIILQGWCSDQPPKRSVELLSATSGKTSTSRDLFATSVFDERLEELGDLRSFFKSTLGHVVVRVEPMSIDKSGNADNVTQKYHVYVLNGNRHVQKYFGPYNVD